MTDDGLKKSHWFALLQRDRPIEEDRPKQKIKKIPPIGGTSLNSSLTDDDVMKIRDRYALGGITQKALGERYGITTSTVSRMLHYKTWRDI